MTDIDIALCERDHWKERWRDERQLRIEMESNLSVLRHKYQELRKIAYRFADKEMLEQIRELERTKRR